jgi:hypothetical protein
MASAERATWTAYDYEADFRHFAEFVAEFRLPVDPVWATEPALARFLRWLEAKNYAPATIRRRLYGTIATVRARRPGAWPTSALPAEVRQALSRARRPA